MADNKKKPDPNAEMLQTWGADGQMDFSDNRQSPLAAALAEKQKPKTAAQQHQDDVRTVEQYGGAINPDSMPAAPAAPATAVAQAQPNADAGGVKPVAFTMPTDSAAPAASSGMQKPTAAAVPTGTPDLPNADKIAESNLAKAENAMGFDQQTGKFHETPEAREKAKNMAMSFASGFGVDMTNTLTPEKMDDIANKAGFDTYRKMLVNEANQYLQGNKPKQRGIEIAGLARDIGTEFNNDQTVGGRQSVDPSDDAAMRNLAQEILANNAKYQSANPKADVIGTAPATGMQKPTAANVKPGDKLVATDAETGAQIVETPAPKAAGHAGHHAHHANIAPAASLDPNDNEQLVTGSAIKFDPKVQTLQLLMQADQPEGQNYSRTKVDGKFGEKTQQDVNAFLDANKDAWAKFQTDNKITSGQKPSVDELLGFVTQQNIAHPASEAVEEKNLSRIKADNNFSDAQMMKLAEGKETDAILQKQIADKLAQAKPAAPQLPGNDDQMRKTQAELRLLGYKGKDGQPLEVTGKFNDDTTTAVNQFRADMTARGVAMPKGMPTDRITEAVQKLPEARKNLSDIMTRGGNGGLSASDTLAAQYGINDLRAADRSKFAESGDSQITGTMDQGPDDQTASAYAEVFAAQQPEPAPQQPAADTSNVQTAPVQTQQPVATPLPAAPQTSVPRDPVAAQYGIDRAAPGSLGPVNQGADPGVAPAPQPQYVQAAPVYVAPLEQRFNPYAAYRRPCAPIVMARPMPWMAAAGPMVNAGWSHHNRHGGSTWANLSIRPW